MCWCCGSAKHNALWPVFWILAGTLVLLYNLELLPEGAIRYWPMVFIIGGLFALLVGEDKEK